MWSGLGFVFFLKECCFRVRVRVRVRVALQKLACSRRSDSGEHCEVKRSAKKEKPGRGRGPPLLFIPFFTSQRSPHLNAWNRLYKNSKKTLSKTPPSGRWGSNNHDAIFVGEWEWELYTYSFILMLIMAF